METIKVNKVEKEIKKLNTILSVFHNMNEEAQAIMAALGYSFEELGSGSSAYTTSQVVKVQEIKSNKYLNGKFLVVGCSNYGNGKGVVYCGYVKEVVD